MLQATNRTTLGALNKHRETLQDIAKNQLAEDDRQLVNLLLGVTLRHIENPNSEDIDASSGTRHINEPKPTPSTKQAESEKLLKEASKSGQKLTQEHYVAYFACE